MPAAFAVGASRAGDVAPQHYVIARFGAPAPLAAAVDDPLDDVLRGQRIDHDPIPQSIEAQ
jgi:hypothetical protein